MAVGTHHAGLRVGPPYRLTDATNVLDRRQCPLRIGREKREVLFTLYLVSLLQCLLRYVSFVVRLFALEGGGLLRQQGTGRFVFVTDEIRAT